MTPTASSELEEWGRITQLDGALICEGRVTFGSSGNILVHIRAWFERSIREQHGFLFYQKATYAVELLYYTDKLLAAVVMPSPPPAAPREV